MDKLERFRHETICLMKKMDKIGGRIEILLSKEVAKIRRVFKGALHQRRKGVEDKRGLDGDDDDNNGGIDGDDVKNGGGDGDDDNNGGGGGKNDKKGSDHDGNGDKYQSDRDSDEGGEMKGKNMDVRSKAGSGYSYAWHAGNENEHPVGQLQCALEVTIIRAKLLVPSCNND